MKGRADYREVRRGTGDGVVGLGSLAEHSINIGRSLLRSFIVPRWNTPNSTNHLLTTFLRTIAKGPSD